MTRLERLAARATQRLIEKGAKVVVATSGGPDSQALLAVLHGLGVDVVAVGIDHDLRSEAARELDVAEALAGRLGVPFVRRRVTVAPGNLLAEARRARYAALTAIADEHRARHIAVGHTATDQLETVLLHLLRGSGITAKLGMRAQSGRVVRPLLACRRADVLAYLEQSAIAYCEDPSNNKRERARARLRADVLPVLRALNPRIEDNIGRWASDRHDDDAYLQGRALRCLVTPPRPLGSAASCVEVERLAAAPRPLRRRALAVWLTAQALTPTRRLVDRLEKLLTRNPGKVTASQGVFYVGDGCLWVVGRDNYDVVLPIPGEICVPNSRTCIVARLDEGVSGGYGEKLELRAPERAVAFDANDLHVQLRVRGWQAGDRMVPFAQGGFRGSVKIGDLFTNAKVPRAMRPGWPVVVHGSEIVWVVGLRRGSVAPITSRTRRVLTLEVLG